MQLTDEQMQAVREWVQAGEGLSDIQKRIKDEFEISLTYMDVRFLVLDLNVEVQDKEVAETVDLSKLPDPPAADGAPAGTGGVTVELDRVTSPGSVVSGTVDFSDGVHARWSLDQMGRLALDAGQEGYQPTPEDLENFQLELRNLIQSRGL